MAKRLGQVLFLAGLACSGLFWLSYHNNPENYAGGSDWFLWGFIATPAIIGAAAAYVLGAWE